MFVSSWLGVALKIDRPSPMFFCCIIILIVLFGENIAIWSLMASGILLHYFKVKIRLKEWLDMVKHSAEQCKEDSMEKGEKMRREET